MKEEQEKKKQTERSWDLLAQEGAGKRNSSCSLGSSPNSSKISQKQRNSGQMVVKQLQRRQSSINGQCYGQQATIGRGQQVWATKPLASEIRHKEGAGAGYVGEKTGLALQKQPRGTRV